MSISGVISVPQCSWSQIQIQKGEQQSSTNNSVLDRVSHESAFSKFALSEGREITDFSSVGVEETRLSAEDVELMREQERAKEEERRRVEEERLKEEERKRMEEQKRMEEERRQLEERKRAEEEERRRIEERRRVEEERMKEEERRAEEEEKKRAEERLKEEEQKRLKEEEQKRIEEERRTKEREARPTVLPPPPIDNPPTPSPVTSICKPSRRLSDNSEPADLNLASLSSVPVPARPVAGSKRRVRRRERLSIAPQESVTLIRGSHSSTELPGDSALVSDAVIPSLTAPQDAAPANVEAPVAESVSLPLPTPADSVVPLSSPHNAPEQPEAAVKPTTKPSVEPDAMPALKTEKAPTLSEVKNSVKPVEAESISLPVPSSETTPEPQAISVEPECCLPAEKVAEKSVSVVEVISAPATEEKVKDTTEEKPITADPKPTQTNAATESTTKEPPSQPTSPEPQAPRKSTRIRRGKRLSLSVAPEGVLSHLHPGVIPPQPSIAPPPPTTIPPPPPTSVPPPPAGAGTGRSRLSRREE